VPPGAPVLVDDAGREAGGGKRNGGVIGPYRRGESPRVACEVKGGESRRIGECICRKATLSLFPDKEEGAI